jgi:hypothetical protein
MVESVKNIENINKLEKSDGINMEIIKKKRGRKPKVKTDDNIPKKKRGRKPKIKVENVEPKIPKKRGRKPKLKTAEDLLPKIPKKRGRKPKNKYSVLNTEGLFQFNNESILILHLPLSSEEIQNVISKSNQKDIVKYNPDISEPVPYDPDNILTNYALLNKYNNKINDNMNNDIDIKYEKYDDENEGDDILIDDTNIIASYVPIANISESFQNESSDVVSNSTLNLDTTNSSYDVHINNNDVILKRNLRNIMYEFIDYNKKKTWPSCTNVYCMWCCHPFTTPPCAIPKKYINGIFYLYGCYCSYNCVASAILHKNTEIMWEQYSLLNLLYRKIYNTTNIKIKCAHPREVLKIFGGFLSIEEYRSKLIINDSIYKVLYPPMVSIIPQIEENIIDTMNKTDKELYRVGKNNINNSIKSLRLKRDKSIINNNESLMKYMDIKVV